MPKIDIEPTRKNDLDPPPRRLVSIVGDLCIMTLKPNESVPDRHVAAFFTEDTDAVKQNLHVLLDGKTGNNIIVEADENGKVIVDREPVEAIVFGENFSTQVKQPHLHPSAGPYT